MHEYSVTMQGEGRQLGPPHSPARAHFKVAVTVLDAKPLALTPPTQAPGSPILLSRAPSPTSTFLPPHSLPTMLLWLLRWCTWLPLPLL